MTWENVGKKYFDGHSLRNRLRNSLRNPVWRDVAMTHIGPLQNLSDHLRAVARGPRADRLLDHLSNDGLRVDPEPHLMVILDWRDPLGRPDPTLVECLAHWAPRDELAVLGLIHLLRPRLELMAIRLTRHARTDLGVAECEVIGAAWEVLTRRPPPGRSERLDAIWREVRRSAGVRRMQRTTVLPEDFDIATPEEPDSFEHWPGLIDAAGSAGVLTSGEAELIVRTRIDGEALSRLAEDLGRPYDALRMERRRAEAALRSYISGGWGSSS